MAVAYSVLFDAPYSAGLIFCYLADTLYAILLQITIQSCKAKKTMKISLKLDNNIAYGQNIFIVYSVYQRFNLYFLEDVITSINN